MNTDHPQPAVSCTRCPLCWLAAACCLPACVTPQVFAELPNLQRLYLHANQIRNLTDVDRLQQLTQLRSLTLHGNPIQENKLYRMYIISTIPWLRTLDFSAVTRKDLDIAITWRQMTLIKKKRRQTAAASAEAGAGSGGGAASGDAGS